MQICHGLFSLLWTIQRRNLTRRCVFSRYSTAQTFWLTGSPQCASCVFPEQSKRIAALMGRVRALVRQAVHCDVLASAPTIGEVPNNTQFPGTAPARLCAPLVLPPP